ncbi:DNA polymerase III subunit delta [Nitratireductor indicus C115]|uniref:DNA polymerase III subunit delta n=1 Tax=Nitratireductor indicus C115 TaxID=1231190 RepID=K2P310_9HYPH|nr:DNA polymerase III subunit delta [Nitratireductor indicus]EKF41756.1 DNA polymerase III subunit delta [Nitratireductor indicus C115]SFQ67656.1 DNA polymerase III, delta subunit [Nitratireductor indicus]
MAQKKAHEVDRWLARPEPEYPIVLIYGPDRGLVSERSRRFAQGTGLPLDDPFTVVRLEAGEVEQQPGRLSDEVRTVPMFSDRRLIWVKSAANQKALVADVAALIKEPPTDCIVLIEGGDLRKGAGLRSTVEGGKNAMALPCYADDGRGIDAMIDEALEKAGLRIALDARQALKANLGGDRLATRGELEKLALYCTGQSEISAEDVRLLIGDVAGLSTDEAVDAVITGQFRDFDSTFKRFLSAGNPPFLILSATLRQIHALQIMRRAMDANGQPASSAVASARPPVFFSRRKIVETALTRWNATSLQNAADRLQAAILRTRQKPALAEPIARQALIALAVEGSRGRR